MRPHVTHYRATFALTNGKTLTCEYACAEYAGSWDEPPSSEVSDPVYHLGGDSVEYDELPKGLSAIADDLYENYPPKHGRVDTYDPRDYD
jgi:hypothetical protein